MRKKKPFYPGLILLPVLFALGVSGCQSRNISSTEPAGPATEAPANSPAPTPAVISVSQAAIRIKAGASAPYKDSRGNIWSADQGFRGGETMERPDLIITNTTEPGIYLSEHYGMNSFSWPLANGNYQVKLHFCETYDGISGPGQRVFSFNIAGREFKDFDVWAKAGGAYKAYVETVPVEITNGNMTITFTSNVENPQINGIEIIAQSP